MASHMIFCIIYTLIALCCSVNGAFVTSPNNVAELTNNAVVLTCTTDSTSGISWSYLPIGSSSLTPIAPVCKVGAEFQSVYHTEGPASDVCKLMVNNTQLTNAGTYLCQEVSTSRFSTAQLVVLEPLTSSVNVTTSTAAESDVVEFTCSVGFNSSQIIPSIRWTSGGDAVSHGVVTTSSANLKLSVYRVTAGTSHLPSYKCEVYFTPTTVTAPPSLRGGSVDQNTPTYTDSQTFAPITVTYCPRNVALDPTVTNGSTVPGGTTLRCLAAGNPSPNFRWTNSTGDIDVTGPTFTVEVNTFYVLTCTANNIITHSDGRQQTCSHSYTVFFNTTVVAPTTSEPSTPTPPPLPVPAAKRHSNEAVVDSNSQPLSNSNRQQAATYEPVDVDTRTSPVSHQQRPTQTGQGRGYSNVGSSPDANTASHYEELNINTQRPAVYDQLKTPNKR